VLDRRSAPEPPGGTEQSAGVKACPLRSASRIAAWIRPSSDLIPRGPTGRRHDLGKRHSPDPRQDLPPEQRPVVDRSQIGLLPLRERRLTGRARRSLPSPDLVAFGVLMVAKPPSELSTMSRDMRPLFHELMQPPDDSTATSWFGATEGGRNASGSPGWMSTISSGGVGTPSA
jgi:hypothetical protein